MDGITVETAEGGVMKFTPEDLLPLPATKGGRGRQLAPDLKRVVPAKIFLVDWDDIERREAAGEVVLPGTAKELKPVGSVKPVKPSGIKW